jgi:glycogen debranching enzyme
MLGPEMMHGSLDYVRRLQGTEENRWRDEQPGRVFHEAHGAPASSLNKDPKQAYYGDLTSSAFYPMVLSQLWHWTGDKALVKQYLDPALKALKWLDEYGDIDGDGFYEYQESSPKGVKNQAWKDSPDAVVDEDGSLVHDPMCLCETQSLVYFAKLFMAETLWWLDEKELGTKLFEQARELKKRFNEAFWQEDLGYFAMGLDSKKRPIRSIGSDPGHCLATGIIDQSLVERTAERMFKPDLFSGWGVRTLSSEHAAYNPYSYHRGSVWPVENAIFALALRRYNLMDKLHQLTKAQFEAAELFSHHRLPEVLSGHQRTQEQPFPALYPQANSPQSWSSSAIFAYVQALLGIYPYAPMKTLVVNPALPKWLPEMTVRNLRVGEGYVSIRFYRKDSGESSYEVLDKKGAVHVVHQPSPWSLTATLPERAKDLFESMLPGK